MFWKASERNYFQESIAGGVVSMSLARRNQKVGSPGCIELSVCAVRTTDDYVRVPPLNLPVLPVAHCSRPIVNDPAIHVQHTLTFRGNLNPQRSLPRPATCHLPWLLLLLLLLRLDSTFVLAIRAGFVPIHASLSCQCVGIMAIVCQRVVPRHPSRGCFSLSLFPLL